MGQWPLKWIPNGLPNCPWLIWVHFLTFWSITALIYDKNTNYLNMWKIAVFGVLTLAKSTDQTGPFSYDLVIFLSVPHVGWLRKINNEKMHSLVVWSDQSYLYFFTEFWVKNFETFWNFQKSFWWPKKPWNHPKTIHIWFPLLTTPPKNMFFCPKRGHICQIDQIGKGRETL